MANNKATTDNNMRDIISKWVFQDRWLHGETKPSDELVDEYIRALMNIAGADGVLADTEREWILGSQAAQGISDRIYNQYKTYMPNKTDLDAMINNKPVYTKEACRPLIFEGFLAASADNELHPAERDAIYRLGRAMGMEDTLVEQLEKAAANEIAHRRQVVALVFPQGVTKACEVAEVDVKKSPT